MSAILFTMLACMQLLNSLVNVLLDGKPRRFAYLSPSANGFSVAGSLYCLI